MHPYVFSGIISLISFLLGAVLSWTSMGIYVILRKYGGIWE